MFTNNNEESENSLFVNKSKQINNDENQDLSFILKNNEGTGFIKNEMRFAKDAIQTSGIDAIEYLKNISKKYNQEFDETEFKKLSEELYEAQKSTTLLEKIEIQKSNSQQNGDYIVNILKTAQTVLAVATAAAAVMVTGYWAAAWFFGFTIGAAIKGGIAISSIALVLSAVTSILDIVLLSVRRGDNWSDAFTAFNAALTLGNIFYNSVKIMLIKAMTFITVSVWAVPIVAITLPVIGAVLALLSK
ncbi:hypothetical protein [Mycoplasma testudineum]|nr:hypothetical protein [Mycoplasma testudineum]